MSFHRSADATPRPEAAPDPDRLREAFERAGYTERGLPPALGMAGLPALVESDAQTILARSAGAGPLGTLARLFLLGMAAERASVCEALGAPVFEALAGCGVLAAAGDDVAPRARLLPYDGLVLASDLPLLGEDGARPDYVMGPGSGSMLLANLMVRRPCRAALDLGTGGGVLAFVVARDAQRVVAVDVNPRALRMAAFNARLNPAARIEWLRADFTAPLHGRAFDLVVSNPPYVISPARRYWFRDGGMPADGLCRRLVREAPALLREGGLCQVLCHFAHVPGERWQDRLASWCAGTGCDALALRFETQDPASYAATWASVSEAADAERLARSVGEWVRNLEAQGIEAVSAGLVTLRRRDSDAVWFRAWDAPRQLVGPGGEAVLRAFAAQDFLAERPGDDALLAARLRTAPEARLEQHCEPGDAGWRVSGATLRLARGIAYSARVEPLMAELVGRCDGVRPLRDVLAELTPAWRTNPSGVVAAALPGVRSLAELGFLLPAGDEPDRAVPGPRP
jgi:SAM-dependent methyltransferase